MIGAKKTFWGSLFTIIPLLLTAGLSFSGSLSRIENSLIDFRYRNFNPGHHISDRIVLVEIDENALELLKNERQFGRWPWRRSSYPGIFEYIYSGGPKSVIFDILFAERTDDDRALIELNKRYSDFPLSYSIQLRNEGISQPVPLPAYMREKTLAAKIDPGAAIAAFDSMSYPPERIAKTASQFHSVTFTDDEDGISRHASMLFQYGGSVYPALSLRAFLNILDNPRVEARRDALEISGSLDGRELHRNMPLENGTYRLHFYPAAEYTTGLKRISIGALIESKGKIDRANEEGSEIDFANLSVTPDVFTDKIVILCATAAATFDEKRLPYGTLPGVMLHATALSNLIQNEFLIVQPLWTGIFIALVLLPLTAYILLRFNRMLVRIFLPSGLFAVFLTAGAVLFYRDIAVALSPVLVSFPVTFLGLLGVLTYFEGAEKRRFKTAMSKYLSPDVLEEVMKKGDLRAEVGDRKTVTVLFSDVRGFTTMAETMDPARVVEILNEYFSKMVSIIFHNRGTLDKFIGDAIMAFWGAPIVRPDHAWLAVKTALEMIQGLRELNRHWASRGIPPLAIGIGIHSGNVIVGNIGSDQRLDYTLIGDNVNLGSRLEGLTKQYGVEILLSETTLAQLNGRVAVRFLDLVTVKGKTVPVGIYEPLEENTYKGFTIQQVVSGFDRAFHAYRERRWEEAISLYGELAKTRDGDDKTARLMIERCEYYKNDPPEADWDGSFTMKTK